MTRNELIELFKKYIMPKPQRRKDHKNELACSNLVKEVKKIKLNRNNAEQPMDCSPQRNETLKRPSDNTQSMTKRQRIQWP